MNSLREEVSKPGNLMECVQGNPRTMKRIVNILLLACSLQTKDSETGSQSGISVEEAKQLLKIVIMIEQWPFRSHKFKNHTKMIFVIS